MYVSAGIRGFYIHAHGLTRGLMVLCLYQDCTISAKCVAPLTAKGVRQIPQHLVVFRNDFLDVG